MRIAKRRNEAQHGVTLLELIIAISLVAIISAGMLTAMRTSLMTNDKVASRLEANRARVNVRQMIARQLGGAMPVTTYCNGAQVGLFDGAAQRLRFVSSFSIVEGSHGYPQIVEYSIAPSTDGGFRLLEIGRAHV